MDAAPTLQPIQFDVPQQTQDEKEAIQRKLEEAKQAALQRAARFGVEPEKVHTPSLNTVLTHAEKKLLQDKRRHDGFATGIDLESAEERQRREARAARFGVVSEPKVVDIDVEAAVGMEVDNYDDRHDPSQAAQIREDAIYMFGTDNLSTQEVLHYFDGYGPSRVEWINDSACNIVFADKFTAKRALHGTSVEAPEETPTPPAEGQEAVAAAPQFLANTGESSSGISGPATTHSNPYRIGRPTKKGEPVRLRLATNEDVKPAYKDKPSRYYEIERQKRYQQRRRNQEQRRSNQRRNVKNLRDLISGPRGGVGKKGRRKQKSEGMFGYDKVKKRVKVNSAMQLDQIDSGAAQVSTGVASAEGNNTAPAPADTFTAALPPTTAPVTATTVADGGMADN